jgi:glutaminyl-peptide cyclotransferase
MSSPDDSILSLVRMQTALGPRVPGSPAHDALGAIISERLSAAADEVHMQRFAVRLRGIDVACVNLIGVLRAGSAHPGQAAGRGSLLLGTHYDTRPIADRDPDPGKRVLPIPGANDGGSGTAILLHLLRRLRGARPDRDVLFVFFDAEDLGDIENHPFSIGAEFFASHASAGLLAAGEAVILDMVGGDGMVLDVDAHILHHEPSRALTQTVFSIGEGMEAPPFLANKPQKLKYIICDQWAFIKRGIPSCLLIDIDYPPWHTHGDVPEAMSESSLRIIEEVVWSFLRLPRA